MDEHRGYWSAAGGVVMVLGLGGALTWYIGVQTSADPRPDLPVVPVVALVLIGAVGAYGMISPLLRLPPWRVKKRQVRDADSGRTRDQNLTVKKSEPQQPGTAPTLRETMDAIGKQVSEPVLKPFHDAVLDAPRRTEPEVQERRQRPPPSPRAKAYPGSLRAYLEAELVRGEELLERIPDYSLGAAAGLSAFPVTTPEEVANWADGVEDLLRRLPNGTRKVARFRTLPVQPYGGVAAVGLAAFQNPLRRELEHRVNELGKIIDAMEDDDG